MPAYRLNPSETAALSLLLHLPIQPGSVLSIWLAGAELRAPGSLPRLVEQGYQSLASRNLPLEPALLQALTLLSVNAAHLTVVLRRSGRAAMSRFALVGRYALQYGIQGEHLVIHPVIEQQALAEKLLPAWFFVHKNENLQMEMPAGAFLLFKQACILADLTAAESNLSQSRFPRNRLWQQAQAAPRSAAREAQQAVNPKQRLEQEYRFLLQERFLSEQAKNLRIHFGGNWRSQSTADGNAFRPGCVFAAVHTATVGWRTAKNRHVPARKRAAVSVEEPRRSRHFCPSAAAAPPKGGLLAEERLGNRGAGASARQPDCACCLKGHTPQNQKDRPFGRSLL